MVCNLLGELAASREGDISRRWLLRAAEGQASLCGSLDSGSGLPMGWGAPPEPWVPGQPCSRDGLEAICVLSPLCPTRTTGLLDTRTMGSGAELQAPQPHLDPLPGPHLSPGYKPSQPRSTQGHHCTIQHTRPPWRCSDCCWWVGGDEGSGDGRLWRVDPSSRLTPIPSVPQSQETWSKEIRGEAGHAPHLVSPVLGDRGEMILPWEF